MSTESIPPSVKTSSVVVAAVPTREQEDLLLRGNSEASENVSVANLHASILREKEEPQDGDEPVPLWLVLGYGVLIFIGGFYLAKYSGGFDANVYEGDQVAYGPHTGGAGAVKVVDPVAIGKRLYSQNCASCHQATGQGVAGQYPPLQGAELLLSQANYGENHLIGIMLDGLVGPIKVGGSTYNGNMPAWAGTLKDDQIANILTYLRQEWGNTASPVSPEAVAALHKDLANRTAPWTDDELRHLPPATLESAAAPASPSSPAKK